MSLRRLCRRRRDLGHEHPQVALDGDEQLVELAAARRQRAGEPDRGLRLVDRAVQLDRRIVLARPARRSTGRSCRRRRRGCRCASRDATGERTGSLCSNMERRDPEPLRMRRGRGVVPRGARARRRRLRRRDRDEPAARRAHGRRLRRAARSRAATRSCARRGPTSSSSCTARSSTWASTSSRRTRSGASPSCSPSTGSRIARPSSPTRARRSRATSADQYATPTRAEVGRRLDGTGHEVPVARPDPLRRRSSASYEELAYGLLEGGVDLLIVETMYDLLGAKAAINAAHRAMRRHGRRVPVQAQVTIELTGRMLPGTEIAAAITSLVPDGHRRARPQLRDGPRRDVRAAPLPGRRLAPPAQLPPERGAPLGRRRQDALRPVARRARRAPLEVRRRVRRARDRRAAAARRPSTSPRVVDAVRRPRRPRARLRVARARRRLDLHLGAVPPGHERAARRRAHQRERVQEVP